ncbi:SDR family oxidoreductase [Nocardia rhizosphaerihabitans]|uniref:Short-chain dehydrogenase n=1 Tax=Nocardia rhizosphaerihabitans TaxID=1691570 RepID=A0ABQ2KXH5_9NOCA|nr:SDR family oxidoreductase [Nocardia rhizosphaerihabitans]GGN95808.1 short-chain dehydrogenase [Nocardia rhizosphaerihabitans]
MSTNVITGASSGLGAEMARQFAARGHDLGLCARRVDRLDALRAELLAAHPGIVVHTAALDVTDDAAVQTVFEKFRAEFGTLDRVVVNAGIGHGAALGTGGHAANRRTALTNFVGALSQSEHALAVFRAQGHGHLVLISSFSAVRGMRRSMTTYAASKAGVAALAEGLRSERIPGVDISLICPGYIRSEMTEAQADRAKFMVDTETGVAAMVRAIEARKAVAYVPAWPWVPLAVAMKVLPLSIVRKLT